nr:Ku protein [uncultured Lichenicoccus sp.]
MAERPIWRGLLRLALVSCPVALYSVRQPSETLHFHFINPDTNNRVRTVTLDAETDQELSRRDLKRGYEFEKDRYVVLDDEDFESAKIESSGVLKIDKFVEADSIDPIYYDASYYVVPDGNARDRQDDVYVVLREAIGRTGRVALSRLVIARRERAVAIMPMRNGLVLHTLHDMREIADPDDLFADLPNAGGDKEMVGLATQLIDRQTTRFEPADMEDRYESRLRAVIEAKLKGVKPEPEPEQEERGNVVDLMAALRQSLGESSAKTTGGAAAKSASGARGKAKSGAVKPAPTKSKPGKAAAKSAPPPKAPARRRA